MKKLIFIRLVKFCVKWVNMIWQSYHQMIPSIHYLYSDLGIVIHEQKREWKQALELFEKALNIYQHAFSSQHPDVRRVKAGMQRVSTNLKIIFPNTIAEYYKNRSQRSVFFSFGIKNSFIQNLFISYVHQENNKRANTRFVV